MWLSSLFSLRRANSLRSRPARRATTPCRLAVEALEDRTTPSFLAPITSPGGGQGLKVADFNRDGRADVLVISGSYFVTVSLGREDGTFQQSATLRASKGDLFDVRATDVNGDGILDVVAKAFQRDPRAIGLFGIPGTEYTSTWLGNGDGTFGPRTTTSVPSQPSHLPSPYNPISASGDVNRDGIADRVTVDSTAGVVAVSLGNADGTYQPARTYPAGQNPGAVAVGDVNGDGWLDIIVVNSPSSRHATLSVLLNDGSW
ncbi:MAG TPA: VCBS repeat-containing protein [Gemmataceae bacterium]|nr:VCBS repeat-containing protein [Gemmataceae bacterium]